MARNLAQTMLLRLSKKADLERQRTKQDELDRQKAFGDLQDQIRRNLALHEQRQKSAFERNLQTASQYGDVAAAADKTGEPFEMPSLGEEAFDEAAMLRRQVGSYQQGIEEAKQQAKFQQQKILEGMKSGNRMQREEARAAAKAEAAEKRRQFSQQQQEDRQRHAKNMISFRQKYGDKAEDVEKSPAYRAALSYGDKLLREASISAQIGDMGGANDKSEAARYYREILIARVMPRVVSGDLTMAEGEKMARAIMYQKYPHLRVGQ